VDDSTRRSSERNQNSTCISGSDSQLGCSHASSRGPNTLYQPLYPVTAFAQERLVIDAMFSGIRISLFQASQHASMMAS